MLQWISSYHHVVRKYVNTKDLYDSVFMETCSLYYRPQWNIYTTVHSGTYMIQPVEQNGFASKKYMIRRLRCVSCTRGTRVLLCSCCSAPVNVSSARVLRAGFEAYTALTCNGIALNILLYYVSSTVDHLMQGWIWMRPPAPTPCNGMASNILLYSVSVPWII